MLARDYWKAVTVDRSDLLDRFLAVLRDANARFCVIGGQGVNAYVDSVVSLDLDLVIAVPDLPRVARPSSVNFESTGSSTASTCLLRAAICAFRFRQARATSRSSSAPAIATSWA